MEHELKNVRRLTGKHFGALLVTIQREKTWSGNGYSYLYLCECACGEVVDVLARDLKSGARDRCTMECEPARKKILAAHRRRHSIDSEEMDLLIHDTKEMFNVQ